MIYLLSCKAIEEGGGVYRYILKENGDLVNNGYLPCNRPMYAVKTNNKLCVLLREPFDDSKNSGYFFVDESLQGASEIESTKGVVACHLYFDKDVYIANYLSGNIVKNGEKVANRIGKGVHPIRQTQSHTHYISKTVDGYFAVCDLGTDALAFYDENLNLISESACPKGYGIRHLVFSNNNEYVYAVNELVPSISVFLYEHGKASFLRTVKIPCKNEKADGAGIRLSKSGKYLYVSLREENVICVFEVDGENLTLLQTKDCGGEVPRDFDLVDDKIVICNEKSGDVVIYKIENGLLTEMLNKVKINSVLCVVK